MSVQITEKIVDGEPIAAAATEIIMVLQIGDSASQIDAWTIWLANLGASDVTMNIYSSFNGVDYHLYDTSTVSAGTNGTPVQGYDESSAWLQVEIVDSGGAGTTVDCFFRGVGYGATS